MDDAASIETVGDMEKRRDPGIYPTGGGSAAIKDEAADTEVSLAADEVIIWGWGVPRSC